MTKKSSHARSRWHERAPPLARTLSYAWEHATSVRHVVPFFTDKHGNEADDVRLYHAVTEANTEYAMLLIAHDNLLRTTYEYDGLSDSCVEAYIDEIYETTLVYE